MNSWTVVLGQSICGGHGMRFMINEFGSIEYWGTPDEVAQSGCNRSFGDCIGFPDVSQIHRAVSINCTDWGLVVLDINGDIQFEEFSGRFDVDGDVKESVVTAFRRGLESEEVNSRIWCNDFACVRLTNRGKIRFNYVEYVEYENDEYWRSKVSDFDGIYDGQIQNLSLTDTQLAILKTDGSVAVYDLDYYEMLYRGREFRKPETGFIMNQRHGAVIGIFPDHNGDFNCVQEVEGETYRVGYLGGRENWPSPYGELAWLEPPLAAAAMQSALTALRPDSIFLGVRYGWKRGIIGIHQEGFFIQDIYALVNGAILSLEVKFSKDFDFEKRASRSTSFDFATKKSIRCASKENSFNGDKDNEQELEAFYNAPIFAWVDVRELNAWWSPSRRKMIYKSNWSAEFEEIGWAEPDVNRARLTGRNSNSSSGRYDPPLYLISKSGEVFMGPVHQQYYDDFKGASGLNPLEFDEERGYYTGSQFADGDAPLAEPLEWRVAPRSNAITQASLARLYEKEVHWGVPFKLQKSGGIWEIETEISGVDVPFVFDTGASITYVSQEVGAKLFGRGILRRENYEYVITLEDASGNRFKEKTYVVPEIVIGHISVRNVLIAVSSNPNVTDCLLGQSFLEEISSYQFNSQTGELIFFE